MSLQPEQLLIASVVGYEPCGPDEASEQYQAYADFQDAPKGAIACTGNVYRNKRGILRCYWIPTGGNYSAQDKEDLEGWYDIPTNEEIEEWTFDSCCLTPCGDEVEPDHIDSWLSILRLI